MNKGIDNALILHKFISLRNLEDMLYDLFEGTLDFNKRKVELNIIGEREGANFYKSICTINSGWMPKINTEEHIIGNIEYWIAPNAVVVYPKILKE